MSQAEPLFFDAKYKLVEVLMMVGYVVLISSPVSYKFSYLVHHILLVLVQIYPSSGLILHNDCKLFTTYDEAQDRYFNHFDVNADV